MRSAGRKRCTAKATTSVSQKKAAPPRSLNLDLSAQNHFQDSGVSAECLKGQFTAESEKRLPAVTFIHLDLMSLVSALCKGKKIGNNLDVCPSVGLHGSKYPPTHRYRTEQASLTETRFKGEARVAN